MSRLGEDRGLSLGVHSANVEAAEEGSLNARMSTWRG